MPEHARAAPAPDRLPPADDQPVRLQPVAEDHERLALDDHLQHLAVVRTEQSFGQAPSRCVGDGHASRTNQASPAASGAVRQSRRSRAARGRARRHQPVAPVPVRPSPRTTTAARPGCRRRPPAPAVEHGSGPIWCPGWPRYISLSASQVLPVVRDRPDHGPRHRPAADCRRRRPRAAPATAAAGAARGRRGAARLRVDPDHRLAVEVLRRRSRPARPARRPRTTSSGSNANRCEVGALDAARPPPARDRRRTPARRASTSASCRACDLSQVATPGAQEELGLPARTVPVEQLLELGAPVHHDHPRGRPWRHRAARRRPDAAGPDAAGAASRARARRTRRPG